MKFTKDQFASFIDVCDIISHLCSDIHIVDGKINQTNDSKIYMITTDVKEFVPEFDINNFKMLAANNKLKLMSMMACDDGDVIITERSDYYDILGQTSSLSIRIPSDDMLTNNYDDTKTITPDEDNKIIHVDILPSVIKLIKKATTQAISQSIEVVFNVENHKAEFYMISTNKNIMLKLMDIDYNSEIYPITETMKTKINWDCFIGNPSKVAIDMYPDSVENVLLFKLEMCIEKASTIKFYQKVRVSKV